jgi:hypothetical protein
MTNPAFLDAGFSYAFSAVFSLFLRPSDPDRHLNNNEDFYLALKKQNNSP